MAIFRDLGFVLWVFLKACTVCFTSPTCVVKHQTTNGTTVDCSHLGLVSFPTLTFDDVTGVDVSFNQLTALQERHLSHLPRLRHLDLSHNVLRQVDKRALWKLQELETLDLSHNRLTFLSNQTFINLPSLQSLRLDYNQLKAIQQDVFQGLTQLLHLDVGNNQLQVLLNDTFSHLRQLRRLGLRSNRLERLEIGAMAGLSRLKELDLSHNQLALTSSVFPPRVFASLAHLHSLHIEGNDDSNFGGYPDNVFTDLVSLQYLAIDTFYELHFGPDFAALAKIHTLDLSDNCKIHYLSNSSLHGFKNSTLSFLKLDHCNINDFELCAFCDLPELKRLSIVGGTYVNPVKIVESLYGLQHQTLSEINMEHKGSALQSTYTIDSHVARFLRNICVLSLRMSDCRIQRITGNALTTRNSTLITCLEHLDLSQNTLWGDTSTFLKLMTLTKRLRTLSMQDQKVFSIVRAECLVSQNFRCRHYLDRSLFGNIIESVQIPTPPNITHLNISSLFTGFTDDSLNVTFPSATQLKTLDVSYIGIASCRTTLYGLENLETLNMGGNNCYDISETIFDYLFSLKKLGLSNSGLNLDFLVSRGQRLFQNLDQLEVLDLSMNNLLVVDPAMLREQRRLRELDFAGNRFQAVPIHLDNHDLTMLDLSHNMLTTLTYSERAALDKLSADHDMSVRLEGNPLECGCFNLDFVRWLWQTSVSLDGEGHRANYTCTTETGEMSSTEQVMAHRMEHWRRCVGGRMLAIAMSAFLTQLLGLLLVFIIARSWTQLCYAWKTVRRLRLPKRHHFRRDAYVVYADMPNDVLFACVSLYECLQQQYGVRLLLRDREELPGSVRAESIVQHIDDSWKVMLLVTLDFCQDEWACGFTVQQAQRSISDTMPDRVIIVFLEEPMVLPATPSLEMLLRMVPERNVLHVHRNTPAEDPVWRTLADLITEESE